MQTYAMEVHAALERVREGELCWCMRIYGSLLTCIFTPSARADLAVPWFPRAARSVRPLSLRSRPRRYLLRRVACPPPCRPLALNLICLDAGRQNIIPYLLHIVNIWTLGRRHFNVFLVFLILDSDI
jgi:hypothetical protein